MQFRFDEDQLAIRDAVGALCADRLDLAGIAAREGSPADAGLWQALADLGVLGMLAGEPGSPIGIVEASVVFEQLGGHLVTGPVLWSAVAAPLVDGVSGGGTRVAGVEAGPHAGSHAGPHAGGGSGGSVVVEHAGECDALLVLHPDRVELCPPSDLPPGADGSPLDPLTPVVVFPSLPAGEVVGGPEAAGELRRSGAVLSAALLVGGAQGALDVARDYALEREQFGVPIGSFQAIKHLLADMYVRVELARAAMYAAAASAAGRGGGDPDLAAGAAKVLAGEAGVVNGRAAVQILGGMGFTWDMLPHYFLKRAWVLEHAFGTGPAHAARLGDAVGHEVVA